MKPHKSYLIRIKEVQEFTLQYYEPGRHDKCFKHAWKKYVYPKYGINYNTLLRYMHMDTSSLDEEKTEDRP